MGLRLHDTGHRKVTLRKIGRLFITTRAGGKERWLYANQQDQKAPAHRDYEQPKTTLTRPYDSPFLPYCVIADPGIGSVQKNQSREQPEQFSSDESRCQSFYSIRPLTLMCSRGICSIYTEAVRARGEMGCMDKENS